MAAFVGARVQVVLQPSNAEIHGRVRDLIAGQALILDDVFVPSTGARFETHTIPSSAIADLRIIAPTQPFPQPVIHHSPVRQPPPPPPPSQQLSNTHAPPPGPQGIVSSAPFLDNAILSAKPQIPSNLPVRTLTGTQDENGKRRQRRPKQKLQDPAQENNTEAVIQKDSGAQKRGKGWRETPLLQPESTPAKSRRKDKRRAEGDGQNGWATEDATDIQDMGEFDFEANHKLFNKQEVFDDLRKGDTTADEERLVSHNKLPPRKNLLPTEMVLSPKGETQGSDADTEIDLQTARSSSRHSHVRKQQSRTNSGFVETKPARSTTRNGKPLPISTASAVKNSRNFSPHSAASTAGAKIGKQNTTLSGLSITHSRAACPTLHPSALVLLENAAHTQYGLPVEAITESAARSIAELAIQMVDAPSETRRGSRVRTGLSASSHGFENVPPVIVVLAGNHTTGSRAVASVRHLAARGFKIILAEAQFGSSVLENDDEYAAQLSIVKKMLRSGANIKRGAWPKANDYIKGLNGPPVLIIDALLAGARYEDVAEPAEGQAIRKIIDWANRSRAAVLSVTCPSGLSGEDGSATIVDGEPLAVKADALISLGAPVTGVLEALRLGERFEAYLADIGVNIALKAGDAVDFGVQWVAPLSYGAVEQDVDD